MSADPACAISLCVQAPGVDYYGLIFAVCLGQDPALNTDDLPRYNRIATNLIIPVGSGGTFAALEGEAAVAGLPGFFRLMAFFKPGASIPAFQDFVGFPAFVLGVHDDMQQGLSFMNLAMQTVHAKYETPGKDIAGDDQ